LTGVPTPPGGWSKPNVGSRNNSLSNSVNNFNHDPNNPGSIEYWNNQKKNHPVNNSVKNNPAPKYNSSLTLSDHVPDSIDFTNNKTYWHHDSGNWEEYNYLSTPASAAKFDAKYDKQAIFDAAVKFYEQHNQSHPTPYNDQLLLSAQPPDYVDTKNNKTFLMTSSGRMEEYNYLGSKSTSNSSNTITNQNNTTISNSETPASGSEPVLLNKTTSTTPSSYQNNTEPDNTIPAFAIPATNNDADYTKNKVVEKNAQLKTSPPVLDPLPTPDDPIVKP